MMPRTDAVGTAWQCSIVRGIGHQALASKGRDLHRHAGSQASQGRQTSLGGSAVHRPTLVKDTAHEAAVAHIAGTAQEAATNHATPHQGVGHCDYTKTIQCG